ncbi:hypothetical protein BGX26_005105, partial [Mortierella sp. AD094]
MDTNQPHHLIIPHQLLEALPTLDGKYFYTKPANPLDDPVFQEDLLFSANPYQQYQAPKIDLPWPNGSGVYQDIDANLAKIQERQAYTTMPLDSFATWTFASALCPEVMNSLLHLLHFIRSQLAIAARQIQEMRLDNYAFATGTKHALATENGTPPSDHAVTTRNKLPESKSKARKSVRGSLLVPSSGITESISPLLIPEIRAEIGRYLKRSALARCAIVCKDWNETFSRHLYSAVEITKKLRTNPPPEALHRNISFIKSLTVLTDRLDPSHSNLVLPNLQSLTLRHKIAQASMSYGPTTMIRNNTNNIRKIELTDIVTHDQIMFWKAVSSLTHLEELKILEQIVAGGAWGNRVNTDKEINAFWDSCSRVKKLSLVGLRFLNLFPWFDEGENMSIPASTIARTLAERTFPLVHDLTISECTIHVSGQFMLIMKCQNLERLEWSTEKYVVEPAEMTTFIQDLTQNLASGKWLSMKSLAIGFHSVQDATFAELIRAFENRTLEELHVSTTQFGKHAFSALRHHFSTLRVLNIRDCPNLTSVNVMELLVSCPRLQSLTVGRIYAWYLDPNQVWPCSNTLQSLSIEFELCREPNVSESPRATEKTPHELNGVVFTCLGQLRELKHLTIGYHEPHRYSRQTYVRASIPLEIQLPKGLGQLAGLKKLRHFAMGILTSSLGPNEVDWM